MSHACTYIWITTSEMTVIFLNKWESVQIWFPNGCVYICKQQCSDVVDILHVQ